MERYFYRRGERVPVTAVEGVLAVRVEGAGDAARFGEPAADERVAEPALDVDLEEARALQASGWSFVRPGAALVSARAGGDLPAEVEQAGPVFTQSDGHLLIGTANLTVQFRPEFSENDTRAKLAEEGLTIVRELRFAPNQFEVAIPGGADVLDVANALQESDATIYAEPTFVEHIGQRLTPTDPTYPRQWQLNNTGTAGGVSGADISAQDAWDFSRGAGTRVAVIDNGFDVTHGDLSAAIVAESGFFDNAGNFRQTLTNYPDSDHGTFCAGMAAARHNNALDGCGSAPESELLLVAARNDQVGTQTTLARAVAYAANPTMEVAGTDPAAGADVIVSSLGPNGANWALTTVLQNALQFAARQGRKGRGTPIFWATSNGNFDIALDQVASHPDVIGVGRSRRSDREDNSARGEELDFLAPGVNVVSTASGGGTRTDTGTSFAAPLSAGVAALILSISPDLSADDVRQIMRRTCDKIGGVAYDRAGHNLDYGFGRVNAFRAVIQAMQSLSTNGVAATDHDGDDVAEIPVVSPWGIGTLEYNTGSMRSLAMAANGSRFGGWLLNTVDNRFPVFGDLDGDDASELLVTSPWGIGVLNVTGGGSYGASMLAPNGTRFGGWLLNTADNRFGPVGDFDGDGVDEMLVHSPWGLGMLKLNGSTFSATVMHANGTRFGGWLLNTKDNWFGPVGDFDHDGSAEVVVGSPWGLGMLRLDGTRLDSVMLEPNGTRFGGWLLNTKDNRIWAAADFDGDGTDELLVSSPWGVGVLELDGTRLDSVMLKPNGTRFGGWLLNTLDNRFRGFADITGGGRADILVESPWGIGIFTLTGTTFDVPFMAPNGTRFGGWLLNTHDNRF